MKQRLQKVIIACIGPITAQTAREYGFTVQIQPSDYTIEALTGAILDYFRMVKISSPQRHQDTK
jgi:uroporphyrinogen-III synthase